MISRKLPRRAASSTERSNQPTRDRRFILDALDDQSLPITERQLAATLTADKWDDHSREEAQIRLRHVDLPKLADSGHITWNEAEGLVTGVDLPASETPPRKGEGKLTAITNDIDNTLTGKLRVVLHLVQTLEGPHQERNLAHAVAAVTESADPDPETVDQTALSLRHNYLPKLDRAGFVEYDPTDGTVSEQSVRA